MSMLDNVRIVLVEPIFGGNIGSVCRAMNNNDITDLAIVNPRPTTDWDDARKLSCNAKAQLEARKEYPTLAEAIAGCTVVAGTSARTGFYRDTAHSPREFAQIGLESAKNHKIALVFGREDKGLQNEELALCTHIIQIPSSELYTSLNLSHAVMVCCYEMFTAAGAFHPAEEKAEEADSELRERMFATWREMMIKTEFTHEQKLEHMMMGLRRIFTRGKLTVPDAKILMGLAKQSIWVSDQWKKDTNE
ncbi:tRNA (cytidine/uridine-2'-O-)-methyltransferase TrmJ [Pontiella sulfatireligans]|uniref:tRNA (cytidine/uridine-2'-O-)-methyltransferase TrmJ n=2 Tax=Pontiella sulfatireligans TaxID=2750658 RepID=A0A6C2ULA8_9BACT|nr:tRNA (cytidine/uridine-2'-O-)-methyltransferase TrmJ [Pontiella sulfatireligans]